MKLGALDAGQLKRMLAFITVQDIIQSPGDHHALIVQATEPLAGVPQQLNGSIQQLQGLRPARGKVLLRLANPPGPTPQGVPVLVQVRGGKKPIYILTEPDLMNNQGLADETRAETALAIVQSLRNGSGPVRMDVTLNGMSRAPSLFKALFEPPFRGATLCALLAALLMALHALARFGAATGGEPRRVRGKRALADNTAALVHMMGREAGMAARYVQASREMVLARLGRPGEPASRPSRWST